MSFCDSLISMGLAGTSCTAAPAKGYERVGLIMNRSDIDFDSLQYDATLKNTLTAMTLLASKKAYKIVQNGSQPFNGSSSSLEEGTYGNTMTHGVTFAILTNDKEQSDKLVDGLLNGEFVMVLEAKDKGEGNASAFKVFGLQNGLHATALDSDPYGDASNGVVVTLQETEASRTATYLGATYASGKAIWEALLG